MTSFSIHPIVNVSISNYTCPTLLCFYIVDDIASLKSSIIASGSSSDIASSYSCRSLSPHLNTGVHLLPLLILWDIVIMNIRLKVFATLLLPSYTFSLTHLSSDSNYSKLKLASALSTLSLYTRWCSLSDSASIMISDTSAMNLSWLSNLASELRLITLCSIQCILLYLTLFLMYL